MRKPFSAIGMLLTSLLLFVSASAPTLAQSPTSKLEQLVRNKGVPFKINPVSAGFLGLGEAAAPVIQHPLTDESGNWHSVNVTSDHTIVLMFMPASKTYAIYWRLTPPGEIAQTVYGTIGKGSTQKRVSNSDYVQQFWAELEFWQVISPKCVESNYKDCGIQTPQVARRNDKVAPLSKMRVTLKREGGTYVVPVLINSAITLDFVVDSGAADVSIPADVVMTLMRTGTLKDSDFLGQKTYVLADGSKVPSQTFRIRSLKVGNRVLENVSGSVASVQGSLLLGQSFLSRFKSWSIDNANHALFFE